MIHVETENNILNLSSVNIAGFEFNAPFYVNFTFSMHTLLCFFKSLVFIVLKNNS